MTKIDVSRAVDRIRRRRATAQLCVIIGGKVVLNEVFGCRADSLFWIFSASKPFMAMLIYMLAERGQVRLDDPVALHWPEFSQHGKSGITLRQILRHRSGLVPSINVGDALAITDWSRFTQRIAASRPSLSPGEGPVYQPLSYGFILGEVIQRVTGHHIRDVLSAEILQPLGMRNTFLGLPKERWERHVPVSGEKLYGSVAAWSVNRRAIRCSVNPSIGISTTAADLAVFYQMLLNGGIAPGRRILAASSIEMARTLSSNGQFDRGAGKPIRWAQGFQLSGLRSDPRYVSPMGSTSSPLTFGHNGSECCIGWADPTRQIAFAYLTNRFVPGQEAAEHLAAVADDILAAA